MTQRNDGDQDAADSIEPNFRDMCAMFAMSGMVSSQDYADGDWDQASIAEQAYRLADAMLAARERT
jgi:hypothetical protein